MHLQYQFQVLDISNNELNSVLPDCITIGIADLWALKLSGNHLEGSLLLEMCVGQYRWLLDLSDNKFSGSIPPCSNQSDLQIVDLSQNNLIENFPITGNFTTRIFTFSVRRFSFFQR